MSTGVNRLAAEGDHRFKGTEIDRAQPLSFQLDGRTIHGFKGDTVLSATIASGIIAAGDRAGEALALDERFAPLVLSQGFRHDRSRALPMDRAPAIDGLDLVTLGTARKAGRFAAIRNALGGPATSLNQHFDAATSLAGPWFDLIPQHIDTDIAIVGGGLSGLGAALSAGKSGARVVLIERRQVLGGDARFFGSIGDEEAPDVLIDRLAVAIARLPNITVLMRTEAFALFEGEVRAHQIAIEHNTIASRALTIKATRLVLANGAVERLPIFPGNRLPGVTGAVAAFHRADRFGLWVGRHALLSTVTSVAYRVAMQAKSAGIAVDRIADTRPNPQSRFIEYSKAFGIPLGRALRPVAAEPARRGTGLVVQLSAAFDGITRLPEEFTTDQLLVSGGWQPDLSLWFLAGGSSRWQRSSNRLEAEGTLAGIALAGAVAGIRNASACIQSGEAAAAELFGRSGPKIDDPQIDQIYETPDDPTSIVPIDAAAARATYLDGGISLTLRPAPASRRSSALWPFGQTSARSTFGDQARPLSIADVAAAVQLGAIPSADATIVAQERCVASGDIVEAGRSKKPDLPAIEATTDTPPAYLGGRFGAKPTVWLVEAADGRAFEVGCLVHLNSDRADPLAAIGVVFAPAPEGQKGALAVIGNTPVAAGDHLMVRDISGPIAVTILDPAERSQATIEAQAPKPADAPRPAAADGAPAEAVTSSS